MVYIVYLCRDDSEMVAAAARKPILSAPMRVLREALTCIETLSRNKAQARVSAPAYQEWLWPCDMPGSSRCNRPTEPNLVPASGLPGMEYAGWCGHPNATVSATRSNMVASIWSRVRHKNEVLGLGEKHNAALSQRIQVIWAQNPLRSYYLRTWTLWVTCPHPIQQLEPYSFIPKLP